MAQNDKNLQGLYNTLKQEGYNPPAYNEFVNDMRDDKNLQGVRNTLIENGYTPPEFSRFKADMFGAEGTQSTQSTRSSQKTPSAQGAGSNRNTQKTPSTQRTRSSRNSVPTGWGPVRPEVQQQASVDAGLQGVGLLDNTIIGDQSRNVAQHRDAIEGRRYRMRWGGRDHEVSETDVVRAGGFERWARRSGINGARVYMSDKNGKAWHVDVSEVGKKVKDGWAATATGVTKPGPVRKKKPAPKSGPVGENLSLTRKQAAPMPKEDPAEWAEGYERRKAEAEDAVDMEAVGRQVMDLGKSIDTALDARGKELLDAKYGNEHWWSPLVGSAPGAPALDTTLLNDPRYRALSTARSSLDNAERLMKEARAAAGQGKSDSWRKSFVDWLKGAGRGFVDSAGDLKTWDMGVMDVAESKTLYDALATADKGGKLTAEQQQMLDAKALEMIVEQYLGGATGRGYKAGQITAESIPFMLEMIVNPASSVGSAATARLTRYAIKRYGTRALKNKAKRWIAAKVGAGLVGSAAGAGVMAATTGAPAVVADAIDRKIGTVTGAVDNEGNVRYGGHEGGEDSWVKALGKAYGARSIEEFSEMMFGPANPYMKTAVGGAMKKIGLGKLVDAAETVSRSGVGEFLSKTKWNGLPEEYLEEVGSNVLNALVVGDMTLDTAEGTGVFNADVNLETLEGLSLMSGGIVIMKTGSYPIERRRAMAAQRRELTGLSARAGEAMAAGSPELREKWEELRLGMMARSEEDAHKMVGELLASGTLSRDQKSAVLDYAAGVMKYRGMKLAAAKLNGGAEAPTEESTPSTPSTRTVADDELTDRYTEGYATDEPAGMAEAQTRYEYQRERAEGLFEADVLSGLDDDGAGALASMAASGNYTQDELEAAQDYVNARTVRDGIIQRVNDDIDEEIERSDAEVKSRVNNVSGQIQPAVMGMDDREVYVVGGRLAVNDDGTIDVEGSDNCIVVRDAQTGEVEMTDPKSLGSVMAALDPEEVRASRAEEIRQKAAQGAVDSMNGTLALNAGDVVEINDGGGLTQVTVVGPAVDGESGMAVEGQVRVKMADGTEKVMTGEQLQQMADAAKRERVATAERERQEARQAARRPQWKLNDEFTIMNESGIPVHGMITGETDEDGMVEIYTEEPLNGNKMNRVTPAELEGMLDSYNGERITLDNGENDVSLQPENIAEGNGNGPEQYNDTADGESGGDAVRPVADDAAGATPDAGDRGAIRVLEEGLGSVRSSHSDDSERNRREAESERLVGIAKENGLYKSREEVRKQGQKIAKRTGESEIVIDRDNKKVYKIKDPYAKSPMKGNVQPEDAIYEHLVHNKYFPETRYRFEGVSDDMGDVRIVLSQDYVESYGQPTSGQIEAALAEKGLYRVDNYTFGNDEITVTDVTGDNALLGADGKVYFIDPIINFRKPVKDIVGDEPGADPGNSQSTRSSRIEGAGSPTVEPTVDAGTEGTEGTEGTALERLPRDERGKPVFERAESPEAAWDALVEHHKGSAAKAKVTADIMVENKRKALEKARKLKPKGNDPDEILASQEANEAALAQAEAEYNMWQQMAGVEQGRQEAMRAQQRAAVRAEQEARRRAEQEETARLQREALEAERKRKMAIDKRLRDIYEDVKDVPEAVEVLEDTAPHDIYEVAAMLLSGQKVLWNDKGVKSGVRSETGFGEGERRKLFGLFASEEKGGKSLQALVEDYMMELCRTYGVAYDNQDARNALIDVISSAHTMGDIRNYIINNRINEALRLAEGHRAWEEAQYDEWCRQELHMSAEEVEAYEEHIESELSERDKKFDEKEYNDYIADEMARMGVAAVTKRNGNGTESSDGGRGSSPGDRGVQEDDAAGERALSGRGDEVLPEPRADQRGGASTDGGGRGAEPTDGVESDGSASAVASDASRGGLGPTGAVGDGGRGGDVSKPTFIDAVKALYEKGKKAASELFQMKFFDVAKTPTFMKALGLTGERFTIRYGVIARHFGKDAEHTIPQEIWKRLPEAIRNPFAITKYYQDEGKKKQKGYRLYTSLRLSNGAFVIVSVEVKNAGRDLEVNAINTIFGRSVLSDVHDELIYTAENITPEQQSLLNGNNPHQYPAERELTEGKGSALSSDKQENGGESSQSTRGSRRSQSSPTVDAGAQPSTAEHENGSARTTDAAEAAEPGQKGNNRASAERARSTRSTRSTTTEGAGYETIEDHAEYSVEIRHTAGGDVFAVRLKKGAKPSEWKADAGDYGAWSNDGRGEVLFDSFDGMVKYLESRGEDVKSLSAKVAWAKRDTEINEVVFAQTGLREGQSWTGPDGTVVTIGARGFVKGPRGWDFATTVTYKDGRTESTLTPATRISEFFEKHGYKISEADKGDGAQFHREVSADDENRGGNREVHEAAKAMLESAGVPVIEVRDEEARRMLEQMGRGAQLMGSRTDRKMEMIAGHYADKVLDESQRAVVDVFSGKRDNVAIEVERADGKRRVVMRQGKDMKAGTKHSLFRHFGTSSNYITADDIAVIPEIIAKGERKVNGNKIAYEYNTEDGVKLKVTTEIGKNGREEFTNFISNRKPQNSDYRLAQNGNTQLSARTSESEVSDAKVDNNFGNGKPQMLRRSDGVVYGWTQGGKVYLNRDAMNPETPLHEYTHLWDAMVRRENPELWARGVELMKQTPLWDAVVEDPAYADIAGDEDAVASEVHSRLTGREGAKLLQEMIEGARKDGALETARAVTLVERLKSWLSEMFKGLKETLGKWSRRDLKNLSLEDFNRMTMRDLARGMDARHGDRSLVGVHNISEQKLFKALKIGGLVNPSVAVIDIDRGGHEGYGEISLVLPSSKIDKGNGNAGTWPGDAWTPTYPTVERRMKGDGADLPAVDMEKLPAAMKDYVRRAFNGWLDGRGDEGLAYWFLHERGEAPDVVRRKRTYTVQEASRILRNVKEKDVFGGMTRKPLSRLTDEERANVREAYIKYKYGGDEAAYDEALETSRQVWERLVRDNPEGTLKHSRGANNLAKLEKTGLAPGVESWLNEVQSDINAGNRELPSDTSSEANRIINEKNLGGEFEKWVEALADRYGIEEVIFDGYTPSGNRRYVKNTAQNVSRLMREQGRNAAVGWGSSFTRFVAAVMLHMPNRESIRKEKGRLTTDEGEVDAFDVKWQDVFFDLGMKCQPDAEGRFDDYGLERLVEAVGKKNPVEYLRKEYGVELGQEDVMKLMAMIDAIRHERPAKYFETKFERPVQLGEFAAAVVPETIDPKLEKAMADAGVRIVKYDVGKDGDRRRALREASDDVAVRFHFSGEKGAGNAARRLDITDAGRGLPAAETEDVARSEMHHNHGYPGVSDVSEHAAMSRGGEDFEATRERAVAERGIVMPGLNEATVRVVEVERHDFGDPSPIDQARKWARENIVGEHTLTDSNGREVTYTISGRSIGKYLSETAIAKSDNLGVHLSVLKMLPDVISASIEAEVHPDYKKGADGKRDVENGYNTDKLIHRFYGAVNIDGETYRVKTTVHESATPTEGVKPHIFEVTEIELLPESNSSTLEPTASDYQGQLSHGTAKLLKGVEKSYDPGKKLLDESARAQAGAGTQHGAGSSRSSRSALKEGAGTQDDAAEAAEPGQKGLQESRLADTEILERQGDGYGAYSDAEVSYINDPISKVMGRNRFSKKRQAEFAARERQRMAERIEAVARRLHLANVEVVTDVSQLDGKRAKAKGFFNKRTGKITIVIPNNVSTIDAEQTLLHEAVAHYGLRRLFGKQFDTFLDNVYDSADEGIRRKIAEMAARNGWNFRTATEEYLAGLAEDTPFEEMGRNVGWWSTIKQLFINMLETIGLDGFRDRTGIVLTDNELRYMLWRSYQNLAGGTGQRSMMEEAEDVVKQSELKVGNYAEGGIEAEYAAEPGDITKTAERFDRELEQYEKGELAPGHRFALGMPSRYLRSAGFPALPISLRSPLLARKAGDEKHPFEASDLRGLVEAFQKPIAIFEYTKDIMRNLIVDVKRGDKHFLVGVTLDYKAGDIEINSVSGLFPKESHEWIKWIQDGKAMRIDQKEKVQEIIASLRTNPAESERIGLNLDDTAKLTKDFENPPIEEEELYRPGDFTPRDKVLARDTYERIVSGGRYQFKEAVQDSMLGLKELYRAIETGAPGRKRKDFRIEEIAGFENAYLYENRMSSMNAGEQHEYYQRYMKPVLKAIGRIAGANARKRRELTDYIMAKHGLERNEYMRKEAAANNEETDRDFAGLTGLTGEADWQSAEQTAQQWVDDYEKLHDTTELWAAINAATKATLEKVYLSGVISKATYEKIRDMYEYYVPLRGWDEKTSDEVYGYLTSNNGPLNGSIMKRAGGRSSVADDPIATIAMMADDAIRQGNRNLMKQRFLNYVLNHPSDAVSVHDVWLEYNDAADEWRPVFAEVEATDSAEEVEQKVEAFEQRMEALRKAEPDKYKRGRETQNIPYKVKRTDMREHQVIVKRGGQTFVLTINGNPRAAQALNGLTNPDVDQNGVVGNMLKAGTWVNRQLSAFYTTRNPEFVVSNFFRDMLYSNCMTWVKESPRYALRFHKNFAIANPIVMLKLLGKWENGSLNMNNRMESLFYQFMINGGETGYTNVKDIEGHKRAVAAELKKQDNIGRKAWTALGLALDLLNRSAENCARFAAFMTSRESGRSIDRAIYDAKEVSVNFNKKGSGGKMVNAVGQTKLGKAGAYVGGIGRLAYVFWNAGIQGTTNFMRQGKRHPVKITAGAAAMFTLGHVIPMLAQMMGGGDGDDDDKNAYYNLSEYERRSNICFRWGDQWIKIPLPIEYRAMYGLGELSYGVISGNEHYGDSELGYQMASQVSQIMPLDMLEGGGGISPFIPSAVKPATEAYIMNKGWTGLPIYKDTPFNKNDPEWTKAYANADQHLVEFTKWLNEISGGDDYKKGSIDINPAKIEYLLNGTFGGVISFPNKIKKSVETANGEREFEWRNIPIANRLITSGDERTAYRKLQNEYFKYKEEFEETKRLHRKYEKAEENGIMGYAEKVNQLENSPEYLRYEVFDYFKSDIDANDKVMGEAANEAEREELKQEQMAVKRELVDAMHNPEGFFRKLYEAGQINEEYAEYLRKHYKLNLTKQK